LENPYGPFDYRLEKSRNLRVVDAHHFTSKVERLIGGQSGYLGGDLDYTLRASPNHHRALMALANWAVKLKGLQPEHMTYTVDCYFDRAFRFRPDDRMPQLIYVDYLGRLGRKAEALKAAEPLLQATDLSAITRNNLGMLMFDLGNYDEALKQCHLAMADGWQRVDLRERLKSVGRWQEPAQPPSDATAEPPPAAPASAP
jgi:tetratricopeptide (TPR) repeat protein